MGFAGWNFWQALFFSINVGLGVGYGIFHVTSKGSCPHAHASVAHCVVQQVPWSSW